MIPPPNTIFTRKRATAKAKESTFVNIEGPRTVVNASDSGPNGYVQTPLLHGVPTFSPMFSQVKITQISTHPKGSHGLLISDAGLLYSYGLNDYGQLGIGVRSSPRGSDHGFVATPTIVTPLLEHGGKAIACAAGVSHSLVVVVTEARRLIKSRSMNHMYNYDDANTSEPVVHHQMYGFGRNDFMKIGLVSPRLAKPGSQDEMECVVLPRRVALRCKVRHDYDSDTLPQGILPSRPPRNTLLHCYDDLREMSNCIPGAMLCMVPWVCHRQASRVLSRYHQSGLFRFLPLWPLYHGLQILTLAVPLCYCAASTLPDYHLVRILRSLPHQRDVASLLV